MARLQVGNTASEVASILWNLSADAIDIRDALRRNFGESDAMTILAYDLIDAIQERATKATAQPEEE